MLNESTRRVGGRLAAFVAAVALLVGAVPQAAFAEPGFVIGDKRVRDPAGLATDVPHQRYWAVPRGSGPVRAWALDASGTPLGPAASQDRATNIAALAAAEGDLFIGDVGGSRRSVTIWRLVAPVPTTTVRAATPYRLRYPDRARTSGAIMVDQQQRFYVITSGKPGIIYRTPEAPKADEVTTLEKVGEAPDNVVDAVMVGGGQSAMRSADTLYLLDATWTVVSSEPIAGQPSGGALTVGLDGRSLIAAAGNEGTTETFALASSTTVAPHAPSPPPTPGVAPDTARGRLEVFAQTGTAVAVVAALGLAVIAGVVVLLRR